MFNDHSTHCLVQDIINHDAMVQKLEKLYSKAYYVQRVQYLETKRKQRQKKLQWKLRCVEQIWSPNTYLIEQVTNNP